MNRGGAAGLGLVLDVQGTQSADHGQRGIGRYVLEHARALMAAGAPVRALLLNPHLPFPGHLPVSMIASPAIAWNTATSLRRAQDAGPVAYHVMSPFEFPTPPTSAVPAHAVRAGLPMVVTVYDLIPLLAPERYLADANVRGRYQQRLDVVRHANLVLSISETTRRQVISHLGVDPSRVVTIGCGVSDFFRSRQQDDPAQLLERELPAVTRSTVVCVSGADDRKNTEALIRAYAQLGHLRASHQLVIVCSVPAAWAARWHDVARRAGLQDGELVLTGRVTDGVLRALYQTAAATVAPSLLEGYGLPVAEAISCGSPAITSSTASLAEVLDWPDSTFDAEDVESIRAVLQRALCSDDFRDRLMEVGQARAAKHSWPDVAQRTLEALSLLDPPSPAEVRRGNPLRLALVGPMPPTVSGVADYNSRLVAELRRRCLVDVLLPASNSAGRSAGCEVAQFPLAALGSLVDPNDYDAVIWTVGNSPHHLDTYEAMLRFHGVAWLHDVRLGGLYDAYASDRFPDKQQAFMRAALMSQYGSRVPESVACSWTTESQSSYSLGLTGEWVSNARALIVNSRFAEHLLRLDQGPDTTLPPVWRLPHAVRVAAQHPPEAPPEPLVAAFGIVHPYKAPELLIRAMRHVREATGARLVFVGDCADDYRNELLRLADDVGLGDAVSVVGAQSADDYAGWFQRVTCSAQLRAATNGETSGAVLDSLAAGLAVVTNAVDAVEEFGEEAVAALPPDADAQAIAEVLIDVIRDPARRHQLGLRALDYARRHTFGGLADRLLAAVTTLRS